MVLIQRISMNLIFIQKYSEIDENIFNFLNNNNNKNNIYNFDSINNNINKLSSSHFFFSQKNDIFNNPNFMKKEINNIYQNGIGRIDNFNNYGNNINNIGLLKYPFKVKKFGSSL